MKQDLERLMRERGLAAMVVAGKLTGNPSLYYMANGAQVIAAQIVKKAGREPVLVCSPIDRGEAAASGMEVLTTSDFDFEQVLRAAPDAVSAQVELLRRIFARLGVRGRVGFYGNADMGATWALLNAVNEQIEGIEVWGEYGASIIDLARATKDESEAARIREAGRRTELVFAGTVAFLKQHRLQGETLVKQDGAPLTIGDAHREIHRLLAEQGLDAPEGVIFANGRDAGVPHNKGTFSEPLRLGQSIIFDIGTRAQSSGYYFDLTRTFSLGYASEEVRKAYADVQYTLETLLASYEAGASVRRYQSLAYDILESRGHPTNRSDPRGVEGFIHGLGHGIGLAVHEEPMFSDKESNTSVLAPGQIFTCEPGVYYPERGYGVRIEDVVWIDAQGAVHNLTSFPKELVVEM